MRWRIRLTVTRIKWCPMDIYQTSCRLLCLFGFCLIPLLLRTKCQSQQSRFFQSHVDGQVEWMARCKKTWISNGRLAPCRCLRWGCYYLFSMICRQLGCWRPFFLNLVRDWWICINGRAKKLSRKIVNDLLCILTGSGTNHDIGHRFGPRDGANRY